MPNAFGNCIYDLNTIIYSLRGPLRGPYVSRTRPVRALFASLIALLARGVTHTHHTTHHTHTPHTHTTHTHHTTPHTPQTHERTHTTYTHYTPHTTHYSGGRALQGGPVHREGGREERRDT